MSINTRLYLKLNLKKEYIWVQAYLLKHFKHFPNFQDSVRTLDQATLSLINISLTLFKEKHFLRLDMHSFCLGLLQDLYNKLWIHPTLQCIVLLVNVESGLHLSDRRMCFNNWGRCGGLPDCVSRVKENKHPLSTVCKTKYDVRRSSGWKISTANKNFNATQPRLIKKGDCYGNRFLKRFSAAGWWCVMSEYALRWKRAVILDDDITVSEHELLSPKGRNKSSKSVTSVFIKKRNKAADEDLETTLWAALCGNFSGD